MWAVEKIRATKEKYQTQWACVSKGCGKYLEQKRRVWNGPFLHNKRRFEHAKNSFLYGQKPLMKPNTKHCQASKAKLIKIKYFEETQQSLTNAPTRSNRPIYNISIEFNWLDFKSPQLVSKLPLVEIIYADILAGHFHQKSFLFR